MVANSCKSSAVACRENKASDIMERSSGIDKPNEFTALNMHQSAFRDSADGREPEPEKPAGGGSLIFKCVPVHPPFRSLQAFKDPL